MKQLGFFALSVLLLAFYPALQKKKVILFGDSITELGVKPGGYISRLDSLCKQAGKQESYSFVGSGIGGNKVYDLYLRMEKDVLEQRPDVVVIYIGVNDVWHKSLLGTGTDADKFEKFYQAIIDKLQAGNIETILCTPAVIGEKWDCTNPQDGDMNRYAQIIRNLATKNKLKLVDLRNLFLDYSKQNNPDNKEKGILTTDRVHLNNQGNELVAKSIWEKLVN